MYRLPGPLGVTRVLARPIIHEPHLRLLQRFHSFQSLDTRGVLRTTVVPPKYQRNNAVLGSIGSLRLFHFSRFVAQQGTVSEGQVKRSQTFKRLRFTRRGLVYAAVLLLLYLIYDRLNRLSIWINALWANAILQLLKACNVEENTILHLPINQLIIQDSPVLGDRQNIEEFERLVDGRERVALFDLIAKIRLAGQDNSVRGILLDLNPYSEERSRMGWATVQEVRSALEDFSRAKKSSFGEDHCAITAHSPSFHDQKMYYLSGASDKVFGSPVGLFALFGMAASSLFYKDLLDRIGVKVNAEAREDYKSAIAPYTMNGWNEPTRENLTSLLYDLQRLASDVARCPKMKYEKIISDGPWRVPDAVELELLSGSAYLQQLLQDVKQRGDHVSSWTKYSRSVDLSKQVLSKIKLVALPGSSGADSREESDSPDKPKSFLSHLLRPAINLEAKATSQVNDDRASSENEEKQAEGEKPQVIRLALGDDPQPTKELAKVGVVFCDAAIGNRGKYAVEKVAKQLQKAANDQSIKVIMLRMNSPGGDAVASDVIWSAVMRAKEKKPVVASYGDVSASGGYYATCSANPIFCNAGTVTGSIGVFGVRPDATRLLPQVRVQSDIVKTDENASFFNIFEEMSARHRTIFRDLIEQTYDTFKTKVSQGRCMDAAQVQAVAGGRVFTGRQALANGLVDRLGGFHDALKYCIQTALDVDDIKDMHHVRPLSNDIAYSYRIDDKKVDVVLYPRPDAITTFLNAAPNLSSDSEEADQQEDPDDTSELRIVMKTMHRFKPLISSILPAILGSQEVNGSGFGSPMPDRFNAPHRPFDGAATTGAMKRVLDSWVDIGANKESSLRSPTNRLWYWIQEDSEYSSESNDHCEHDIVSLDQSQNSDEESFVSDSDLDDKSVAALHSSFASLLRGPTVGPGDPGGSVRPPSPRKVGGNESRGYSLHNVEGMRDENVGRLPSKRARRHYKRAKQSYTSCWQDRLGFFAAGVAVGVSSSWLFLHVRKAPPTSAVGLPARART